YDGHARVSVRVRFLSCLRVFVCFFFFFFQAEDGIRDLTVTGVQTCALPISFPSGSARRPGRSGSATPIPTGTRSTSSRARRSARSEERRVGKECRSRGSP